jgi:hypothetical protein
MEGERGTHGAASVLFDELVAAVASNVYIREKNAMKSCDVMTVMMFVAPHRPHLRALYMSPRTCTSLHVIVDTRTLRR